MPVMRLPRWSVTVLIALLAIGGALGGSARAQTPTPSADSTEWGGTASLDQLLIRLIGDASPELGNRASASFFIYVNVSANEQNGYVGQQIRREIRALMNGFFVDGEPLCFRTFQTKMLDRLPDDNFIRFSSEDRPALFDQVHSFVSRRGSDQGGSDLELAKYTLLGEMKTAPNLPIGIILTNSEFSQQPRSGGKPWGDRAENREQLAARLRETGVTFRQFLLSSLRLGGETVRTYAHIGFLPGVRTRPLPQPRETLVQRQNENGSMAVSPTSTRLTLTATKAGPNRYQLQWTDGPRNASEYLVRIREKANRKLANSVTARGTSTTVSLPQPGVRYGLTVAAVNGRDQSAESAPVFLTGEMGPSLPIVPILLIVLALGGITLFFMRSITVLIAGTPYPLGGLQPSKRIVTAGFPKTNPRDAVLQAVTDRQDAVAEARRSLMGKVTVSGVGAYRIVNARGEDVKQVSLTPRSETLMFKIEGKPLLPIAMRIVPSTTRK